MNKFFQRNQIKFVSTKSCTLWIMPLDTSLPPRKDSSYGSSLEAQASRYIVCNPKSLSSRYFMMLKMSASVASSMKFLKSSSLNHGLQCPTIFCSIFIIFCLINSSSGHSGAWEISSTAQLHTKTVLTPGANDFKKAFFAVFNIFTFSP